MLNRWLRSSDDLPIRQLKLRSKPKAKRADWGVVDRTELRLKWRTRGAGGAIARWVKPFVGTKIIIAHTVMDAAADSKGVLVVVSGQRSVQRLAALVAAGRRGATVGAAEKLRGRLANKKTSWVASIPLATFAEDVARAIDRLGDRVPAEVRAVAAQIQPSKGQDSLLTGWMAHRGGGAIEGQVDLPVALISGVVGLVSARFLGQAP